MSYIRVDSYGNCLNNAQSAQAQARSQSNSELYASYKFVISIENSNCEDYVTEKLIDGLSSTSIPIVASRDGKPDYTRFAPNHSYINIYDFKTVKDLADYLTYLSNNETAYNEYLWFRQPPANKYTVKVQKNNVPLFVSEAKVIRWDNLIEFTDEYEMTCSIRNDVWST